MKLKLRLTDPDGVLESIRNAIAAGGEEVVVDVEIVSDKPRFDRTAYMRELMRKRRANPKPVVAAPPPPEPVPPKPTRKPRVKAVPAPQQPMPAIPASLNTEEFRVAWQRWLDHRTNTKRAPVSAVAAGLQLDELAAMGCATAIESINQSIKGGWQSLQPIRKHYENGSGNHRKLDRNDGNSNGEFLAAQSKAYVETTAGKVKAKMQQFADGPTQGVQPGEVPGSGGDGGCGEEHS